ncbi:MAG: two-component regulator propeller domain-containing protein, partial [Bacteroidota bacterium]
MRFSKKILFGAFGFFVMATTIAQQIKKENNIEKYRAVNWGLNEGISNAGVNAILKDANGFLWVATPFGLNRFDGSTFKKYIADPVNKSKTIPGNSVDILLEDSLHNIWISTNKGLACYDIKTDTFRYTFPNLPKESNPFWATKDEVFFWDFPEQQWAAYNIHSFAKRTLAKFEPGDTVGYGVSSQYAIFDAGSKSLWIERGYQGTSGGLLQVSITDGTRQNFDWPCFRNIPHHSHRSEGMRLDRKRNSIWIASPDGLVEFTLADKKFHHVDVLNELENVKDFWEWAGIDIDKDGKIWICTTPAGIVVYDPSDNSIQLPFRDDPVAQKNLSDGNLVVYCDKEGMVWSGGFSGKGIYQVIPFSAAAKRYIAGNGQSHGLTNNGIINFKPAGDGTMWIGSQNGINIFNTHTDSFTHLGMADLSDIKGHGTELFPLNIDTINKKAWLYNDYNDPYFEMDIASRKCSPVLYEDSNGKRVDLNSALANHPQNKYPRAYRGGIIIAISLPDHEEVLEVNGVPVARTILSFPNGTIRFNDISSICTDDDSLIFLKRQDAPTNFTYVHRNNKWVRTTNPLDSIEWSMINYNKPDQTYWIIAETKLLHYDKNFRLIRAYNNNDGMPGVEVHALINDNKDNVWFTTDRSIFQLNTKTGIIAMLSEKDGLSQQNFGGPFFGAKDDDGDLYITDGDGFNRISPDKYVSSASSVYFESLKINQQLFPLSAGINNVQQLSLKYFENNIVIETGIIDYYSKGKGHIRYKLEAEGLNADWQYAPAYYTIRYEQLPPGKYKLVIQSSNAANEFNGPEKILTINIHPAFWNTWWFR